MEICTDARGFSMLELMMTLAITALITMLAAASLDSMLRRAELRGAAGRIHDLLITTRTEAMALSANRAVKFIPRATGWYYGVYDDCNGNGVLNDEITRGIDRLAIGQNPLLGEGTVIRVGLPDGGAADPDTGAPLTSAVNFNQSTLCSFSPAGSGTPGTIYLTDGTIAAAVRSSGADGNVRILLYDSLRRKWSEP